MNTGCFPLLNVCFCVSFTGDVLQLSLSLRGAVLLPGQGFDAEGVGGRHRSHVHSKGDTGTVAHLAVSK